MKNIPETKHPPTQDEVQKPPSLMEDLIYLVAKIGIILLMMLLLFTFIFGFIPVTDGDMAPQLKPGDLTMVYRLNRAVLQSDVIAIEVNGQQQLRRVIATGGDTVDLTAEGLVINGALQQELTPESKTFPYKEGITFPITLAQNEVFVLGDHRDDASDSRLYGPISKDQIIGKLMLLIRRRDF